ncbi:347ad4e2-21cd-4d1c-9c5f-b787070fbfc0-CDS [Sclerotinia trifoliorum]|uniref:347ad4e2-21cd-4d1c-9c5f-b787070fbfc0-CDS n=1 Tax=Sclerotinia trifoliorum TaxID=28548 RepID=A0A8H2VKQ0_9HELO|nr:347ad4e2-21cd-4d1c-9c5f-b787070fbfc0-CDS [Sclerotinia trifoliorum]
MACYFCGGNITTCCLNCVFCGAISSGYAVKESVVVAFGDGKCQVPSTWRYPHAPHKEVALCMEVEIQFYDIKCFVVLVKDGEKPVRISAVREGASSNLKDSIMSVELKLPL